MNTLLPGTQLYYPHYNAVLTLVSDDGNGRYCVQWSDLISKGVIEAREIYRDLDIGDAVYYNTYLCEVEALKAAVEALNSLADPDKQKFPEITPAQAKALLKVIPKDAIENIKLPVFIENT